MINPNNKKFGGTITNWCLQVIAESGTVNHQILKEQYNDIQTDNIYIFTGTVKDDPTGRWQRGDSIRSSVIIRIHRDLNIIETANTLYRVEIEDDSFTGGDIGELAINIRF